MLIVKIGLQIRYSTGNAHDTRQEQKIKLAIDRFDVLVGVFGKDLARVVNGLVGEYDADMLDGNIEVTLWDCC